MMKFLRWSAVGTAMLLVLAACTTPSPSPSAPAGSTAASAAASAADATAICAADAVGCTEYLPGDPIRIASANSFAGSTIFLGLDVDYGIQIAAADRGTQLFGRSVEVVRQDAGCSKAEDGQTAAQAIVADKSIVAVVGTTCSRTAVPAMPVLSKAGLVTISASNTAPSLTDPKAKDFGGPFYFRTAYNDQVQGAAVAKFACEVLHAKTASTVHDGSPYAVQLQQVFQDQFVAQCGGKILAHEAIQINDKIFPVLTTICGASPDVFFFPIFDPEGPLMTLQALTTRGCEKTHLIGADGIKDDGMIKVAGPEAEKAKMYFSGPDLNFGTKYTDGFLPKYRLLSGTANPIAPYHAHGFDAANILMDAIAHVGVQDADGNLWIPRDAMRQYVAALKDYPGLTGTLTCNEFGDCGSSFVSIAQLTTNPPVPPATKGVQVFTSVFTTRPAS